MRNLFLDKTVFGISILIRQVGSWTSNKNSMTDVGVDKKTLLGVKIKEDLNERYQFRSRNVL